VPEAIQSVYEKVCRHARETALLASASGVLEWDERTKMPKAAGAYRVDQLTLLAGLIHARRTDSEFGRRLDELSTSPLAADPKSDSGATIYRLKRDYQKRAKLPRKLVEQLTRATVAGQQAWETAREHSDFAAFAPTLQTIVDLKRQEADALGYQDTPYDALLDDYEPEERTANVRRVLGELRDALVPVLEQIRNSGVEIDVSLLHRRYPVATQHDFACQVAAELGFDFERGRLDTTTHPFCTGLGPNDCRITTRFDERFFSMGFFGVLHEAGHGIYDQGLRAEMYGLPPGDSVSLGIHESQSRLWENQVGRSRAFWEYCFPKAQAAFPEALAEASLEEFYAAINQVRPSTIRVEADEATYNLHILVRFELELDLLEGRLQVADLPGAWNAKYRDYLGIEPPNDAEGVLQDVHWSAGLFGYFPTYALGNLYAAQFFEQASRDLGDLEDQIRRGRFAPLREWLRERIHCQGQRYSAAELVENVTGRPLSHAALIEHLQRKAAPLYGLISPPQSES
jgi:carboxypeptidase Taq